jgi:hypothetical protein
VCAFCLGYTLRMNDFDPINLNYNWLINGAHPLPSLTDWPEYFAKNEKIKLRRMFDLEPIGEVCLHFILHIEAAPDDTTVKMNVWDVGIVQAGHSLIADVTDYVTLEDNVLLLTVSQKAIFGEVWLERVPCEGIS